MSPITRGALGIALFLGASLAHAAGLGKLTVNSALGQILNAEIDLVSLQPGELDALNARVSPPEAFRDARIEYSPSLRLLRFSVEKRPSGQPYLKITSVAPINEPFVDMLIEVSWPAGRIQREYPILLDPPRICGEGGAANGLGGTEPPCRQPAGLRAGGVFFGARYGIRRRARRDVRHGYPVRQRGAAEIARRHRGKGHRYLRPGGEG